MKQPLPHTSLSGVWAHSLTFIPPTSTLPIISHFKHAGMNSCWACFIVLSIYETGSSVNDSTQNMCSLNATHQSTGRCQQDCVLKENVSYGPSRDQGRQKPTLKPIQSLVSSGKVLDISCTYHLNQTRPFSNSPATFSLKNFVTHCWRRQLLHLKGHLPCNPGYAARDVKIHYQAFSMDSFHQWSLKFHLQIYFYHLWKVGARRLHLEGWGCGLHRGSN